MLIDLCGDGFLVENVIESKPKTKSGAFEKNKHKQSQITEQLQEHLPEVLNKIMGIK